MKKFLGIIAILILSLSFSKAFALYGNYDEFVKDVIPEYQKPLIIPAGSYFRGLTGETVSSEFNNEGDIIKIFVNADFTMNDEIIIPKNSLFICVVRNLGKAQQGMNGYFSIDVIGLAFPDGRKYAAKGYIIAPNNGKVFGGEFSRRSGHKNVLHRSSAFNRYGAMELMQNGPRIMGKETMIKAGTLVNIAIEEAINVSK